MDSQARGNKEEQTAVEKITIAFLNAYGETASFGMANNAWQIFEKL